MRDLEIRIKELIKHEVSRNINVDNLDANTTLEAYGIDSLDRMSVYLAIEEEFGLEIPENDLHLLSSINKIADYILAIEKNKNKL